MEGIDDGWLEAIVKKSERERSVVRVLRSEVHGANVKGDSYGSDMLRIKMDVVLGSGKKTKRSVIVKSLPASETRAEHLKKYGIFEREIKIYRDILPLMEDLMEEFEDRSEPMWGRCLHYRPYDSLTMEDLKEYGYSMGERRYGLDLAHSKLVIRGLAKFHALSVVLQERGLINYAEYSNNIFTTDPQLFQYFHNKGFLALSNVIEKFWGPEWQDCARRLKNQMDTSAQRLIDILLQEENPSRFRVFCHGDPWVANMMFDFLPESDTPIHVKFLDFQLSHFNSFGYDLQYFLTTSPNLDVRQNRIEDLLVVYQTAFQSALKKYGVKEYEVPSLDDIRKELLRLDFFRFIIICCHLSYMMSEPDNIPDVDKIVEDYYENKDVIIDERTYVGPEFTKIAKLLLKNCIDNKTI